MDLREKLIELIDKFCSGLTVADITPPFGYENLADYLIDNGVTVQELDGCEFCTDAKWISGQVTASHPRNNGVICNQIDGDFDFCPMCGRKLPEPPKEDTK